MGSGSDVMSVGSVSSIDGNATGIESVSAGVCDDYYVNDCVCFVFEGGGNDA